MSSAPSPPPAPDYTGAAQATAAGNAQAAQQAQQANLVNQNTPYGTLTYSQDPTSRFSSGNPSYSSNINLNGTGQQLLNNLNNTQLGLSSLQQGAENQVAGQGPMSQQSVQDTANASYAAQTARLDPQWQANTTSEENQLVNQGLRPGQEGYDNAIRVFNQGKNDAYSQATQNAIATEPQTYQLASAEYNQPLNRLNALTTGSQVSNPQFGSTPQQQTTAGPNYLGAAQSTGQYNQGLYNTQVGSANSANSALGSVVGSGLGLLAFSDRALKSKIKRVGTHRRGFGIYEYTIADRREIGVIAQELARIIPHAVHLHPSGFLMVDYGALNA